LLFPGDAQDDLADGPGLFAVAGVADGEERHAVGDDADFGLLGKEGPLLSLAGRADVDAGLEGFEEGGGAFFAEGREVASIWVLLVFGELGRQERVGIGG
jgi:hypothetical protein